MRGGLCACNQGSDSRETVGRVAFVVGWLLPWLGRVGCSLGWGGWVLLPGPRVASSAGVSSLIITSAVRATVLVVHGWAAVASGEW